MRIHFICLGNVYRSILAEAYLNSLAVDGIQAYSSGTIAAERSEYTRPIAVNTRKFLENKGLAKYVKPHWDQLTQERIRQADRTVCLNPLVRTECEQAYELPPDTITWNVTDWDEGDSPPQTQAEWMAYTEKIFDDIKRSVDQLVRWLRPIGFCDPFDKFSMTVHNT